MAHPRAKKAHAGKTLSDTVAQKAERFLSQDAGQFSGVRIALWAHHYHLFMYNIEI